MGTHRHNPIDQATAERLLASDPAITGDLTDLLLAAAPSPVPAGPLLREPEVLALFRSARSHASHRSARGRVRNAATTRLVSTKVAIVGLTVAVGGVALAALTGVLPYPVRGGSGASHGPVQASRGPSSPLVTPRANGHSTTAAHPGHGQTARPTQGPSPSAGPSPAASSEASLRGLCHSYISKVNSGKAVDLNQRKYAPLVAAAGGTSGVAALCASLLPAEPGNPTAPSGQDAAHVATSATSTPGADAFEP